MWYRFLFYCIILDISTSSWLFREGSEENLLNLITRAEKELKIFVYPIPSNVRRCSKSFRGNLWDMFHTELSIPKYYKNSILATNNPEEADLFLVDHEWICLRVANEPNKRSPERSLYTGDAIARDHVLPIWTHIVKFFPFFNRSHGKDHITTFVYDNGPFCSAGHIQPTSSVHARQVMQYLQNVTIIGNNGYSGRSNWTVHCEKPCAQHVRHDFCHREGLDVVIPQTLLSPLKSPSRIYNASLRPAATFYKGQIRRGWDCSPSIRPSLHHLHSQQPGNYCLPAASHHWLHGDMSQSVFALCPAGAACWSMRLYHAIFSDTIPVILADPVIEPFERFLNWSHFTVKFMTENSTLSALWTAMGTLRRLADDARAGSSREQSFVQQKVSSLRAVVPWLVFDAYSERSAYRLLSLELWCRTSKGRGESACKRPVAFIANTSYL